MKLNKLCVITHSKQNMMNLNLSWTKLKTFILEMDTQALENQLTCLKQLCLSSKTEKTMILKRIKTRRKCQQNKKIYKHGILRGKLHTENSFEDIS